MKPQQQNTDVKGTSHVYVQKPDGEQINIPAPGTEELKELPEHEQRQTAENTPSTYSREVKSGEGG